MSGGELRLYDIKGYFFNERLGVIQIIDDGVFAYSPEHAKSEMIKHFNTYNITKVKITKVVPHKEYCQQGGERF